MIQAIHPTPCRSNCRGRRRLGLLSLLFDAADQSVALAMAISPFRHARYADALEPTPEPDLTAGCPCGGTSMTIAPTRRQHVPRIAGRVRRPAKSMMRRS
ncbi:hypothetical protein [Streptosporangium subroseum]|uniref:hypothetical protein n=1 Tax=Streptosporangium subroseum TaxID=106412 RepID=UPI0030888FC5|nr:hypothetical protein OHB15_47555 [Streptosporangium subroseum]